MMGRIRDIGRLGRVRVIVFERQSPTLDRQCGDCVYELIDMEHFLAWSVSA
jgi:hypothetical protein